MSVVQKIQCPSCGSNSTYKLFDGNYKCNYCQSNFNVKEQQQKVRESTIKQPEVILPKYHPKVMWFFAFGIILVMGFSTGIFYFIYSKKDSSITAPFESKQPVIEMTYAFAGSNGAALWLISKVNGSSDSISYKLHIVDPKIKKIISTVIILPAFKNSEDLDFTSKIGSRFLQYDDLAYNISKDNGLVAYNIYSGKKEITTQTLVKNFPELNSGIIKVEEFPGEKGFKITSAQGEVFRLDPYTKQLIEKEIKKQNKNEQKITSQLYLTNGLKHQLYLFTKKGTGFPLVYRNFIDESQLNKIKAPKGSNVKDVFGNINIEKISDKSFFRAQPLVTDNDGNMILFYKSDLSEKAQIILESISIEGKTNWTVKDSTFIHIGKSFSSEDIECIYTSSANLIILSIFTDQQLYIGIDVKTGKILWNFYPQKYASENSSFNL